MYKLINVFTDMKKLKYIFFSLFAIVALAACDTYGDYDTEYSPVYPLSGQYNVTVYDASGTAIDGTYLYLYNTTDNDNDKLWVRMSRSGYGENWGSILVKVSCDVKALTFGDGNTVSDGKLELNGASTPSGGKADAVSLSFKIDGVSYTAKGYRWSGWEEDDTFGSY